MTQVIPAAASISTTANPRFTTCLIFVLGQPQAEQSSHCKPQLKQTKSNQAGCELVEAEIYLCAKAEFCTVSLLHRSWVQKRDSHEDWAEGVSPYTRHLKCTHVLPFQLETFRNRGISINTFSADIMHWSEVLGVFYICTSVSLSLLLHILQYAFAGNYLWYLMWFYFHDNALLVIITLQGSIYG